MQSSCNDERSVKSNIAHIFKCPHDESFHVISHTIVFFIAMIFHELALEAASNAAFSSGLDSLASCVTLFQFGFCFLLPLVVSKGDALKTFPRTIRGCIPYLKLSLVVFGATALATASLSYVSYPTKVVFKSAKLIPTMILSTILKSTKTAYGTKDYFAALLLCMGAAGYSFNSNSGEGEVRGDSYRGIVLLTVSIVCDAIVPNLQKQLMTTSHQNQKNVIVPQKDSDPERAPFDDDKDNTYVNRGSDESTTNTMSTPSSGERGLSAASLMVNVNVVGFTGLLLYMILVGSLVESISAAVANPLLAGYLTLVGLGLSTAVLSYTKLIKSSGPVVAVAVATLRKVATVLLSYLIFPKPVLKVHVFSGLLVLAGVVISAVSSSSRLTGAASGQR